MPRKTQGEKLERVVSTNISSVDFEFLERYARLCYNKRLIVQPTMSHMLRMIITGWIRMRKKKELEDNSNAGETAG